jgi:tRNA threonylcarbamoyl adenosine modification protein (Sua5/YciO/YrdC/YwlC family)
VIETFDVHGAHDALAKGEVVAVPTDTVYGLAASLEFEPAILRIFALKRRPSYVPCPVVVSSIEQIERLGVEILPAMRTLAQEFWPGALTIVVPAPASLAALVLSRSDGVGFRIPNDPLLLDLVERTGPLALTSANDHGEEPCQSAQEIRENFKDQIGLAGVLDDGPRSGEVSSVVEVNGASWKMLRERAVASSEISRVLD